MRLVVVRTVLVACSVIALFAGCAEETRSAADAGNAADARYLAFQVGTYHPAYIVDGEPYDPTASGDAPAFPKDDVAATLSRWLDRLGGERGNRVNRLAFFVGPLSLDHTDEQLREIIRETFELAVQNGVAVGFHIDDSMYWQRRSDLWQSPDNVEWLDWTGTPNTGRIQSWGGETQLAPQMCFNSSAVTAEIQRIARDVIGAEIANQVTQLQDQGLFAGVIAGWETQIGRDYATRAYLGYCALSNLGFSASQPPDDIDLERERVVQQFAELWSGALVEGGVDAKQIYTHIAFAPEEVFEMLKSTGATITYSEFAQFATPWTAFGSTHNPGYSLYSVDVPETLLTLLEEAGNPPWAMSEGAPTFPGAEIPPEDWERFLATRFNHGATLVNLYSHNESSAAVAALQKFLRGEALAD